MKGSLITLHRSALCQYMFCAFTIQTISFRELREMMVPDQGKESLCNHTKDALLYCLLSQVKYVFMTGDTE